MGGYVTMAFAEKYMDNLRGLILFHSTAVADSDEKKADRNKAIKVAKRNKDRYLKESQKKLFYIPLIL
jgi:pimeloyl-ACP methyl ester carboxylesterase